MPAFFVKYQGSITKTITFYTMSFQNNSQKLIKDVSTSLLPIFEEGGIHLISEKMLSKTLLQEQQLVMRQHLFSWILFTKGKENYDKFSKERFQDKEIKFFDAIPKTRSTTPEGKIWKAPDVKKEIINFLRIVDYSRLRSTVFRCAVSTIIRNCEHFVLSDKRWKLAKIN